MICARASAGLTRQLTRLAGLLVAASRTQKLFNACAPVALAIRAFRLFPFTSGTRTYALSVPGPFLFVLDRAWRVDAGRPRMRALEGEATRTGCDSIAARMRS